MKTETEILEALEIAKKDLIDQTPSYDMMPWEIHRECSGLKGINACIKTLQWVLLKRVEKGVVKEEK